MGKASVEVDDMRQKISDYPWTVGECSRLRKRVIELQNEIGEIDILRHNPLKEVGLPTGIGNINRVNVNEFDSREAALKRLVRRLDRMESNLKEVVSLYDYVITDKEWVVLDCRLDGMEISYIARHINISRKTVYRIIDTIIERYLERDKSINKLA